MTWDPACDFLLDLQPLNLFEGRDARPGREYLLRCKGCGEELNLWQAVKHFRQHKRSRLRERTRDIEAARNRGLAAARRARRAKSQ